MSKSRIEQLIELAAKSGYLYAATDVFEYLKPHLDSDDILVGIKVIHCPHLSKGSIVAASTPIPPSLSDFLSQGGLFQWS